METKYHRKIWIKHNGPIPIDENGLTYEIHHIDGNHANNDINNLQCVSIKKHYDIHFSQGDFSSCNLINIKLQLGLNPQIGTRRPGIGGVKKGTIPWNIGLTTETSPILKKLSHKFSNQRKGKQHSSKLTIIQINEIRNLYNISPVLSGVGKIQKNGLPLSYLQAFCKYYASNYNVTPNCLKRIIKKETWQDNVKIKHKI